MRARPPPSPPRLATLGILSALGGGVLCFKCGVLLCCHIKDKLRRNRLSFNASQEAFRSRLASLRSQSTVPQGALHRRHPGALARLAHVFRALRDRSWSGMQPQSSDRSNSRPIESRARPRSRTNRASCATRRRASSAAHATTRIPRPRLRRRRSSPRQGKPLPCSYPYWARDRCTRAAARDGRKIREGDGGYRLVVERRVDSAEARGADRSRGLYVVEQSIGTVTFGECRMCALTRG